MRGRMVRLLAAALLTAGVGACGDDEPTGAADPTSTSTTAEAPAEGLEDGVHFGYLRDFIAGHNEIVGTFDPAELLTGEEAIAATQEEGYEEPVDWFIRNTDDTERIPIRVDPEAEVLDIPYGTDDCCEPRATTPAQFSADREANEEEQTIVELTVADGTVTKIEEIFFP